MQIGHEQSPPLPLGIYDSSDLVSHDEYDKVVAKRQYKIGTGF